MAAPVPITKEWIDLGHQPPPIVQHYSNYASRINAASCPPPSSDATSNKISMSYSTAISAFVLIYLFGVATTLIGRRIIQR